MAERALVAVVGDDPTLANLIVEVLDLGGFDTLVISNLAAAAARIATVRPAAVLLDVRIEHREDYWRIVEQIGADSRTAGIPVVICTADEGFLREHASGLAARGVPCLSKPFEIDDLIAVVVIAAGRMPAGPDQSRPGAAAT